MTGYVVKMFPRFSETFILAEILELERRGEKVHVISLRKPDDGCFHEDLSRVRAAVAYLPEHLTCQPLEYLRAHARACLRSPKAYLRALFAAVSQLPASWRGFLRAPLVAAEAKAAGCERLHAHFASLPAITAMFAAALAGMPFSFTAHAKDIYLRGRPRRLLRALIFRAQRVITVSEFNRRYLSDLAGPFLPPGKILCLYNGVDLDIFKPPPAEPGAGEEPLVLAVGRLVEKKGFDTLLEACSLLRDRGVGFRCEIAGKGPLQGQLASRISEKGLNDRVWLVGPLPHGALLGKLRAAALLAAPCVVGKDGNRDGLPTVILEAMACGVPVVASSVTGIPEAVEHGLCGRLVPPGDPRSLADALADLLADAPLRARMGRAGRERAEALFDLKRNVATLQTTLGGFQELSISPPRLPASPSERGRRSQGEGISL